VGITAVWIGDRNVATGLAHVPLQILEQLFDLDALDGVVSGVVTAHAEAAVVLVVVLDACGVLAVNKGCVVWDVVYESYKVH